MAIPKKTLLQLCAVQKRKCAYCGTRTFVRYHGGKNTLPNEATVEHIRPRCYGGTDDLTNLAMVCHDCNNRRGNTYLARYLDNLFVLPENEAAVTEVAQALKAFYEGLLPANREDPWVNEYIAHHFPETAQTAQRKEAPKLLRYTEPATLLDFLAPLDMDVQEFMEYLELLPKPYRQVLNLRFVVWADRGKAAQWRWFCGRSGQQGLAISIEEGKLREKNAFMYLHMLKTGAAQGYMTDIVMHLPQEKRAMLVNLWLQAKPRNPFDQAVANYSLVKERIVAGKPYPMLSLGALAKRWEKRMKVPSNKVKILAQKTLDRICRELTTISPE